MTCHGRCQATPTGVVVRHDKCTFSVVYHVKPTNIIVVYHSTSTRFFMSTDNVVCHVTSADFVNSCLRVLSSHAHGHYKTTPTCVIKPHPCVLSSQAYLCCHVRCVLLNIMLMPHKVCLFLVNVFCTCIHVFVHIKPLRVVVLSTTLFVSRSHQSFR